MTPEKDRAKVDEIADQIRQMRDIEPEGVVDAVVSLLHAEMAGEIDHRNLLKKFISLAGGASGQCQVRYVVDNVDAYDPFVQLLDSEKDELIRLKAEAEKEYFDV